MSVPVYNNVQSDADHNFANIGFQLSSLTCLIKLIIVFIHFISSIRRFKILLRMFKVIHNILAAYNAVLLP